MTWIKYIAELIIILIVFALGYFFAFNRQRGKSTASESIDLEPELNYLETATK